MNKILCLTAGLVVLNLTPVFAQPNIVPMPDFEQRVRAIAAPSNPQQKPPPELTKFSLDFPGGTPKELVAAIEKGMGKPLNAIIPTEDADVQMPPLKMTDVTVPQLFTALEVASSKQVAISTSRNTFGPGSYSTFTMDYGFRTADSPLSDNSIWYFHAEKPSLPPAVSTQKTCQFYSLAQILDRGFTVDDITTAIQTGWKMAGDNSQPEMNYHKETRLLIVYGEPDKLKTVEDVLRSLPVKSDYWQDMNDSIWKLQQQVKELQKGTSASSTNAAPEEKPGK